MTKVFTTEITSELIPSDNPIHQRLLKPYVVAREYLRGDILEVGCGEGRGIDLILGKAKSYTAIDKMTEVIGKLKTKYPSGNFYSGNVPPFTPFADQSFDVVLAFQVIEHVQNDLLFLKEIRRVLRSEGIALITTPNRPKSLSRNPWHIREYTAGELKVLAATVFPGVKVVGLTGNEKVMAYYDRNKKSVERITRWDIFDLQHRLPASLLQVPYELLNRWNRNKLKNSSDELVRSIRHEDYLLTDLAEEALDLFMICRK